MSPLLTRLLATLFVLLATATGLMVAAAEPAVAIPAHLKRKNPTPEACWDRYHTAQSEADQMGCLSTAEQSGWVQRMVRGYLEREIHPHTYAAPELTKLYRKHGLGDLDFARMADEDSRSNRPRRYPLGAWVDDPQLFVYEAEQLLARADAMEIDGRKARLEKLRKQFPAELAAAPPEKVAQLKDEQAERISELEMTLKRLEEFRKQKQEEQARNSERRPPPKLRDLKIDGDTATAVEEDRPTTKVRFRKIDGSWTMSYGAKDAVVQRPPEKVRTIRYFAARGYWTDAPPGLARPEFEIAHFTTYVYRGDSEAATPLVDADLPRLAPLAAFATLELRDARQVTQAGFASLKDFPQLRTLRLVDMPLSDASCQALGTLTALTEIVLDNVYCSAAALAQLHEVAPRCKITTVLSIRARDLRDAWVRRFATQEGSSFPGPTPDGVRDPERPTLLLVAAERPDFVRLWPRPNSDEDDAEPPPPRDPALPELFAALQKHNVEVLLDPPLPPDEAPFWWEARPYLKKTAAVQLAILPKGAGRPVVVEGEITAAKVLAALKAALEPQPK